MLKQLMLAKKLEQRNTELTKLLEQEKALETRSEELEAALIEAETDEEVAAVEEKVTKFEEEKAELTEKKSKLEEEIARIENEIEELKSKAPKPDTPTSPLAPPAGDDAGQRTQRGEIIMSNRRQGFFKDMSYEQRSAFIEREDVQEFLTHVREYSDKGKVTGAELTFPEVVLELLRDNLYRYSKLVTKVRVKPVGGKSRQNIVGAVPEGVWIEATSKLNELEMSFNQVEVDGYKVGGFIAIPNPTLEDSDENLASEILDAIGQAIGLAVDKAILYGTGAKMPLGIVKRLETADKIESRWGTNAPTWIDLTGTNILTVSQVDEDDKVVPATEFFANLVIALGAAKPNYAMGGTFWAMNRKTRMALVAKAITFNAAGALVAGVGNTMPIEGGDIVELPFIPDGDIIGGYGSLYLLAERAGASLASSEHARFIEDQAVFRGTARYDGIPVFGEGFVLVNIEGDDPTTEIEFALDSANP